MHSAFSRTDGPIASKNKRSKGMGIKNMKCSTKVCSSNGTGGTMSRDEFWKNVIAIKYSKTDNWCTKSVATSY